jgi:hypothetical protein
MEFGKFAVVISKVEETWEVDFESLPEVSQRGIVAYGLKQLLNDCGGEKTTTAAEKKAESLKRLDALKEGTYRFGGGGGGKMLSPVEVEARTIVTGLLMKQKGMKKAEAVEAAKAWRDVVKPEIAEQILAKAKKNVAARDLGNDITL